MTNEDLVKLVQSGVDVKEKIGDLYEQNKNFIYMIAKPYMKYAETDDILQEAYMGFHDAIFTYSIGETKLITYAAWKIKLYCIRYIENSSNTIRIPVNTLELINKYKKFVGRYEKEYGCQPNDKIVMEELKLTEKKLNRIKKAMCEQECVSTSTVIKDSDDLTIEEMIEDDFDLEGEIEKKLFIEHERKVLDSVIEQLEEKRKQIIRKHYWEDVSLKDIAKSLGISYARICQLEKDALHQLSNKEELQELLNEVYGYDSHIAYHLSRKFCLDNRTSQTESLAINRIEQEKRTLEIQAEINNLFEELIS